MLFENPSDVVRKKIDYHFAKDYFRIVFAGNLGDAQDLETLIKIGRLLKKRSQRIIIDILGEGKNFLFLKDNIEKYQLSRYLNLKGYIQNKKMPNFYNRSSALLIILASGTGISKTIPAKFQTYLAYGRPLLVCSNGEINQIVKKNNLGLSCSSGDANMLYENIMLLKKMSFKKYNQICLNCFNIYKNKYLITKKTRELLNIFTDCIKNSKY
jgi:glycosyltransferase involved in cell wall biosynthesis